MKKFLSLCVACFLLAAPPAFAKTESTKKPAKKPVSQNVKIRQKLIPNVILPDLAAAVGSLDYQNIKKNMQMKVLAKLPIPSPSAGIADLATAQAAEIRLELSREGVVTNDCKLIFNSGITDPAITMVNFRLHAKNQGKKFVKGSCGNGLPKMLKGDKVSVYAVVGGVRVDLLAPKP